MRTYRTDNPFADFDRWDAEQCNQLESLPECSECGEKIQDDFCYEINDELICEECMKANYRKLTDSFM